MGYLFNYLQNNSTSIIKTLKFWKMHPYFLKGITSRKHQNTFKNSDFRISNYLKGLNNCIFS